MSYSGLRSPKYFSIPFPFVTQIRFTTRAILAPPRYGLLPRLSVLTFAPLHNIYFEAPSTGTRCGVILFACVVTSSWVVLVPSRSYFSITGEQFELHLRAAAGPKHSTSFTSSGPIKKHVLHHFRKVVQRGTYVISRKFSYVINICACLLLKCSVVEVQAPAQIFVGGIRRFL